ncbi:DNA translocase FtsK [Escherichia coli]|uniref:DNA translocase FtsK n=1 Tax=Escherichia coli TaxID=562 RepID=A0A2X3JMC9_ECOLX|nr:DNA translocase FtsK [Escherichia coli]
MSQEYTEDKEVTLTKLSSGRRLLEALLILIVLFAVWLMAALLSFNPSDPKLGRKRPGMNLSII